MVGSLYSCWQPVGASCVLCARAMVLMAVIYELPSGHCLMSEGSASSCGGHTMLPLTRSELNKLIPLYSRVVYPATPLPLHHQYLATCTLDAEFISGCSGHMRGLAVADDFCHPKLIISMSHGLQLPCPHTRIPPSNPPWKHCVDNIIGHTWKHGSDCSSRTQVGGAQGSSAQGFEPGCLASCKQGGELAAGRCCLINDMGGRSKSEEKRRQPGW